VNEQAVDRYIEVLQQELDRKAGEIMRARGHWATLHQARVGMEEALIRDQISPSLERAEEIFEFVRFWDRRNTEAKRLAEEELRQKNRIYDMQAEVSTLWRKQETLKRLVARQRQRRVDRQNFRLIREQEELLITAGQPPPKR